MGSHLSAGYQENQPSDVHGHRVTFHNEYSGATSLEHPWKDSTLIALRDSTSQPMLRGSGKALW